MKTAKQWVDEYLNHRTTYTDEADLADKKKQRLVAFFERAIADARDEEIARLTWTVEKQAYELDKKQARVAQLEAALREIGPRAMISGRAAWAEYPDIFGLVTPPGGWL